MIIMKEDYMPNSKEEITEKWEKSKESIENMDEELKVWDELDDEFMSKKFGTELPTEEEFIRRRKESEEYMRELEEELAPWEDLTPDFKNTQTTM